MKTTKAIPALVLLVAGAALADDAALQRCRALKESAQRLTCYDAIPLGAAPAPVLAPTPGTAPQAGTPAAATPSIWQRFGFENRAQPDEPPEMVSHIPGLFEGWSPRSSITLANGQVWQVIDETSRVTYLQDPKVKVRRGMLGSFFLDIERINPAPRVRRVQ